VGAGPAGLTAALYLARYRRDVMVLHDGQSRALRIPLTHNAPAFPEGIVGVDLIERMTRHATDYGAKIAEAEIVAAQQTAEGFALTASDGRTWRGRTLILATGIRLNQVDLPREVHEAAIRANVLRYCPVCDGYEHIDRRIGVIGCNTDGAAEALFLRQYSHDITLMPLSHPELDASQRTELHEAGIRIVAGALRSLEPHEDRMDVTLEGTEGRLSFDVVYPALGTRPHIDLAAKLGVRVEEEGCLAADAFRETATPGLFAAGDVIKGLDQISVAMGHGAQAATNAHNWLRDQDSHSLQARGK
jgi:thioredoxin reductase (NADPH)